MTSQQKKASWYLKRLALMDPREVASRVKTASRVPGEWLRYRAGITPSRPMDLTAVPATFPFRLHAEGVSFENIRIFELEFPSTFRFDSHRDYRHGKNASKDFGPMLNTRDPRAVGDIKYIWEINRHQHLSALAYSSDSAQTRRFLIQELDRWLRANRYLCGVNWTSSLELGIRMISWSFLYPRIAMDLDADPDLKRRFLESIYLHLQRIHRHQSRYSSANNHLIGELVGLYVGAVCFPLWKESAAWAAEARAALEQEIVTQVSSDGVNREQAMSYHLFTLELLLLACAVARNVNLRFSKAYETRLHQMLTYLNCIATDAGNLTWYGDSDDARGFLLSPNEEALTVTMQLGELLFQDARLSRFSKELTCAARALIPDVKQPVGQQTVPGTNLFRDGGMVVVDTKDGRRKLIMDFGPLGYTSLAAHGHADALSVWLAIDGEYFLTDCGTYSYHSESEWRTFFRSTAAHNTVRIDGQDQSVMGGRFLWSEKATSRLLQFEDTGNNVLIEAEHDGYARLEDPVIHRRSVRFDKETGAVEIIDTFECSATHLVELFFHLHEDAFVDSISGDAVHTAWRNRRIRFSSAAPGLQWDAVSGSVDPILGWRSRRFSEKHPIFSLRLSGPVQGTNSIRINIDIQDILCT